MAAALVMAQPAGAAACDTSWKTATSRRAYSSRDAALGLSPHYRLVAVRLDGGRMVLART